MLKERDPLGFLAGGGEMGALMRAHDWAKSSVGPPQTWPQALRTSVRLILNTGHPMYIFWGAEGACFYNDAYRQSIGPERHPGSLGRPAFEVWEEIWPIIGTQIDQVMAGGEATWHENALVPITRNGRREDVYWTYSYGPIDDTEAPNGVGGVLVVCTETTKQVMQQRHIDSERKRLASLFEQAPGFMCMLRGPEHRFEFVNPAYRELVGFRDVVGKTIAEALPDAVEQGYLALLDQVYATGEVFRSSGARFVGQETPDAPASERFLDFVYQPILDSDGAVSGIFVEGVDVTERQRLELRRLALVELGDRIRDIEDSTELAYAAAEILGRTMGVSRAGYGTINTAEETITIERDWNAPGVQSIAGVLRFRDYGSYIEDLKAGRTAVVEDARTDPRTRETAGALEAISARSFVNMPVTEQGGFVALLFLNHEAVRKWPEEDLAFIREFAERTRSAVERRRVEDALRELAGSLERQVLARTAEMTEAQEALRQSQKMEAVGQLTGGIAHDFNNMLSVVIGSLDLLGRRLNADDFRARAYVDAAMDGARRAAILTQRLLAFSRQQPLNPKPINVNALIEGMGELLRGSLGGAVQLEPRLAGDIWRTEVDQNQLENVILNLSVNGRDAMDPMGGRLTIETGNTHLDARDVAKHVGVAAGDYVMISVTDTGPGMSPEVLAKAFDPFFTTKEVGKGTGLGLSQVYGFVKQSGGHVSIESKPRQGTTVRVYLPRFVGSLEEGDHSSDAEAYVAERGRELVLVVEDEPAVRRFSISALTELGYRTLEADSAETALRLLDAEPHIALLFTDVVMPETNGALLAEEARHRRPDLKVLFTTGYTRDALNEGSEPGAGVNLLGKPFTLDELAAKVRGVLDATG